MMTYADVCWFVQSTNTTRNALPAIRGLVCQSLVSLYYFTTGKESGRVSVAKLGRYIVGDDKLNAKILQFVSRYLSSLIYAVRIYLCAFACVCVCVCEFVSRYLSSLI